MGLKEIVYQKLDDMKIKYDVINHKAIFSESDTDEDLFDKDILIGKNLFLRNDKKSKYYLVCLPLNKRADLKKIADIYHTDIQLVKFYIDVIKALQK